MAIEKGARLAAEAGSLATHANVPSDSRARAMLAMEADQGQLEGIQAFLAQQGVAIDRPPCPIDDLLHVAERCHMVPENVSETVWLSDRDMQGRIMNRRLRILLAEDDPINQTVALKFLEKLGYRADAVANGIEAIRALETIPYDLVLMDVQMPEMDGIEATRVIRDPQSPVLDHGVWIIALTANAMKGDRERCLEAGMDDYLSKPVQFEALMLAIERLTQAS